MPGSLPTKTATRIGNYFAGLRRQARSSSGGDSQQSSMRCPVQEFARKCTLTTQHQLLSFHSCRRFNYVCLQATLLPTSSNFVPNIKTFLGQWKPNMALIMVRAGINCFLYSPAALYTHTSFLCFTASHNMPLLACISIQPCQGSLTGYTGLVKNTAATSFSRDTHCQTPWLFAPYLRLVAQPCSSSEIRTPALQSSPS